MNPLTEISKDTVPCHPGHFLARRDHEFEIHIASLRLSYLRWSPSVAFVKLELSLDKSIRLHHAGRTSRRHLPLPSQSTIISIYAAGHPAIPPPPPPPPPLLLKILKLLGEPSQPASQTLPPPRGRHHLRQQWSPPLDPYLLCEPLDGTAPKRATWGTKRLESGNEAEQSADDTISPEASPSGVGPERAGIDGTAAQEPKDIQRMESHQSARRHHLAGFFSA
ncbi:hypothetical protein NL676_034602 [Syzygium grande]|nr:hypothetical protein NL676_034602 [Syzygium grande]